MLVPLQPGVCVSAHAVVLQVLFREDCRGLNKLVWPDVSLFTLPPPPVPPAPPAPYPLLSPPVPPLCLCASERSKRLRTFDWAFWAGVGPGPGPGLVVVAVVVAAPVLVWVLALAVTVAAVTLVSVTTASWHLTSRCPRT